MAHRFTKQGVRDLNHIKGPPQGVRLESPPVPVACSHRNQKEVGITGDWTRCLDCDMTWSYDESPLSRHKSLH